ncbi:MAG: hypothetical protein WCE44_02600 [Candidatus Velthaea sp.]
MNRIRIALLSTLFVLGLLPAAASADTLPYRYTSISGTTAVQICTGVCVFGGAVTTAVQTNALNCYDNTAASGTLLLSGILTNATGAGIYMLEPSGIVTTLGLNCQVPSAIVGTVLITWRPGPF